MQEITTGAGLAALGFWSFIAVAVAIGVWDNIRKRDVQHETLRRIIESGQPIDVALTDKLMLMTGGNKDLQRDLKVGGLITLCIAPGLAVLGLVLSLTVDPDLLLIMSGVAVLVGSVAGGLLVASRFVGRWEQMQGMSNADPR